VQLHSKEEEENTSRDLSDIYLSKQKSPKVNKFLESRQCHVDLSRIIEEEELKLQASMKENLKETLNVAHLQLSSTKAQQQLDYKAFRHDYEVKNFKPQTHRILDNTECFKNDWKDSFNNRDITYKMTTFKAKENECKPLIETRKLDFENRFNRITNRLYKDREPTHEHINLNRRPLTTRSKPSRFAIIASELEESRAKELLDSECNHRCSPIDVREKVNSLEQMKSK